MDKKLIFSILLILWGGCVVDAWDSEEMEIFDLVEEMKEESFYNILGISQVRRLVFSWKPLGFLSESFCSYQN